MNLMTLKGLEAIAEEEFGAKADQWVQAIAWRENVGFDELRPHLISLRYVPGDHLEITFIIPDHAPIQLISDRVYKNVEDEVAALENGKLVGDYRWHAFRYHQTGSPSFTATKDLGHALLLARWAHEEDKRAQWWI